MWRLAILACLALASPQGGSPRPSAVFPTTLAPGQVVQTKLARASEALTWSLTTERSGWVTVEVVSYDFEPRLEVVARGGEVRRPVTNPIWLARVDVELGAGDRAEVRLAAGPGGRAEGGELTLKALEGRAEPLRSLETVEFLERAIGLARERGEQPFAGWIQQLVSSLGPLAAASEDEALLRAAELCSKLSGKWGYYGRVCRLTALRLLDRRLDAAALANDLLRDDELGTYADVELLAVDEVGALTLILAATTDAPQAMRELLELLREHLEVFATMREDAAGFLAASRLACLVDRLGERERAAGLHEQALGGVGMGKLTGATAVDAANEASGFWLRSGRIEEARSAAEQAERIAVGVSARHLAYARGNLAMARIELGQFVQATEALTGLHRDCEELGDELLLVKVRAMLAACALAAGDLDDAFEWGEILRESLSNPRPDSILPVDVEAAARFTWGATLESLGRFEEAATWCEDLLSRELPQHMRWRVCFLYGRILRMSGRLDEAAEQQERALAIARRLEDPFAVAAALDALAQIKLDAGALREARELSNEALADGGGHRAHAQPWFLLTQGRIALLAGDLQEVDERVRGAGELIASRTGDTYDPYVAHGVRSRHFEWLQLCHELAWSVAGDGSQASEARKADAIATALGRTEWWRRVDAGGGSATFAPEPLVLPAGTTDPKAAARAWVQFAEGYEDVYAYVLVDDPRTRGARKGPIAPRMVRVGKRKELEALVDTYVEMLTEGTGEAARVVSTARALYDALFRDALPELAASEVPWELDVVPTTFLTRLAFDALAVRASRSPRSFGDARYLIDVARTTYRLTLADDRGRAREGPRAAKALLLGVPELDPATMPPWDREKRDPLSWAVPELYMLGKLLCGGDDPVMKDLAALRMDRRNEVHCDAFDLYVGGSATRDVLAPERGPYGLVHIVAHGINGNGIGRRTGIVLAGAAGENVFSTRDARAQRWQAEVVVLSACLTARGPVLEGQGIQSLARGFLEGGAENVVAAFWNVGDKDAYDLMGELYRQHRSGLGPAAALRAAVLERRHGSGEPRSARSMLHPHFWSSFGAFRD